MIFLCWNWSVLAYFIRCWRNIWNPIVFLSPILYLILIREIQFCVQKYWSAFQNASLSFELDVVVFFFQISVWCCAVFYNWRLRNVLFLKNFSFLKLYFFVAVPFFFYPSTKVKSRSFSCFHWLQSVSISGVWLLVRRANLNGFFSSGVYREPQPRGKSEPKLRPL